MDIRNTIARSLLSIGAVFLRPQEPFLWASGIKSPIYCDNRLILTAPQVRDQVGEWIGLTHTACDCQGQPRCAFCEGCRCTSFAGGQDK